MTALRAQIKTITFSALFAAIPFTAASAQAVEEAAERLKSYAADQGMLIEWDSLDVDGDDVTLTGARAGVEAGNFIPVGDLFLEGISHDNKGYRIRKVSFSDFSSDISDEDAVFSISGVTMDNVLLPDEAMRADYGGTLFYEAANIDEVTLTVGGKDVFAMNDASFGMTEPDASRQVTFNGIVENFSLDLSVIDDKEQLATIQALGYEQINGAMEMAGSWNLSEGRMDLSQIDLTVDDAGTFGLSFDLGGYTPALIASLRDMSKKMASDDNADSSAQGLAMLGLLQQLSFHGAEIAFIDDSLTARVLDYVAGKQGMKAADVANQAKAVAPFLLAQLNNPELMAQATQAVSAFLDNPESLRISARPANPVPFALIAATAMSAPTELTKSLAVSISAND